MTERENEVTEREGMPAEQADRLTKREGMRAERGKPPIAAIYVRVSTTKDSQKDSPEHQEGICREKARMLGLAVCDGCIYEDRDSGTSIVERPAIQKLLQDAQAKRFDAVLFASLSRFSRDLVDSMALKRMLVDSLGVRLISIDENYDSGVDRDEFKFQIFSAVNQKQSEMISLSSRRGLRQSALKGNFTGSIPPYGYRKATIGGRKTLIPDETKRIVVREIFEMYAVQLLGEKAIARALNERLIPSPKGGLWGVTTIRRILQNEAYTGVNVFGKYETIKVHRLDDLHDRRNKLVQRDRKDWERSPVGRTHEPIIEPELFARAQAVRLQRGGGRRGGIRHRKNLFAGLIFCRHCGASMVSTTSNSARLRSCGKAYRYLICSRRRRQGDAGCGNDYWLPYAEFRDRLLADLSRRMRAVASAESLLAGHPHWMSRERRDEAGEIAELSARIRRYREALFSLRQDFADGRLDRKQLRYEQQRFAMIIRQLEQRREEKRKAGCHPDQDALREQARAALEKMLALQCDEEDPEESEALRLMLGKLIERITVAASGEVVVRTKFSAIG